MHYVSTVLGIKDPIHKQKIALKAMDAVLFGPPRGKSSCLCLMSFNIDFPLLKRIYDFSFSVENSRLTST